MYRPITAARQLTVGRVGAIGVRPPRKCSGRQSVIHLRCLSLGRLAAAAQRSSLVQRETLHEDQDPAT